LPRSFGSPPPGGFREARLPLITLSEFAEPPLLEEVICFYSVLFGAAPVKTKPDYAKWMLDDPRVNFTISTRAKKKGVDHLGIQVEEESELNELRSRLERADMTVLEEGTTTCVTRDQISSGYKTRQVFPGKPIVR